MKKNLVTVITFALVLVNLVLTVILTITIIPETKQANELITKVCSAIDLDLEAGSATSTANIPIDRIDVYNIEDSMTINLKKGEDGKQHYAIVNVAISMDNANEDYEELSPQVSSKEELIKAEINNIISSYTLEEIQDNQSAVQEEILGKLQQMFASDFIVGVGFSSVQYQ
jgi:flagellar FliL protein